MPAGIISGKKSDTKVFISHSSEDKQYAQALVKLLEAIGLNNKMVFCSSVPKYGIPLGKDIFEALTEEFNKHALHIIFLLSENYYKSEASLNEMGAAWVLGQKYTYSDEDEYMQRIDELKDQLIKDFSIEPIKNAMWGKARHDLGQIA